MYEKIDKRLLEKIAILNSKSKVNCVILADNYCDTYMDLKKICKKNIIELPIISGFAVDVTIANLYNIAKLNAIKFISSVTRVNSLIFKSKQFLKTNILEEQITDNSSHSVVVIDTGIYPHVDFLLGKNRIIKFVDLINNKKDFYDDNGHGTFVAGVLGGSGIVDKYSGIDSKCNIIVIKALDNDGETTSIKILQAMQWILDNRKKYNIKVVCMSFGSIMSEQNDPLMYGAEMLWNSGICVVSAAGNSGPEEMSIMSPGASRKIITVGSLDNTSIVAKTADFSSRGPAFNYYKPDLLVPGVDIISTNVFSFNHKFYTKMTGTSVSTPMVAGVVSLMYSLNPNYTPDQIKYMLTRSCVKITGDRNSEGFGYLDLGKLILL